MESAGTDGTPDYYYEGTEGRILWVEYKVYPNKPSALQEFWILRARNNGVRTWVATQMPDRSVEIEMNKSLVKTDIDSYVRRIVDVLL